VLEDELKLLEQKSEYISIERSCHDEEISGVISQVGSELVTMNLYTNDGTFDGFCVFEIDQIEEVFWGNREHQAISELIKSRGAKTGLNISSESINDAVLELSSKFETLCIYKHNDEDNFDIVSIIDSNDGWLKVSCYGPKKSLSVLQKLIPIASISRIVAESPYQNDILFLHRKGL